MTATPAAAAKPANKGFDEFGYNYQARVFVGLADGVDRNLDGTVWGDPTHANDHLVMKWSKAWDDARFDGADWTPDAWCTNEWNGMSPGGSQEVWHYTIIWVGPELEDSPYWRDGGYAVWGQFEVVMSHGVVDGEHLWEPYANYPWVKFLTWAPVLRSSYRTLHTVEATEWQKQQPMQQ